MPGWVDINMKIHPEKLKLCLQEKYEAYAVSVGERLREAAIVVFEQGQRNDNEWRKSNRTPPKYISSFRVSYHRATLTTRVENTDPCLLYTSPSPRDS